MQVRDVRAVPEADRLPERLAFKTAENASGGQALAVDDAEGIITAVVSVTGTLDEVDDIIMPGAYIETLAKRRPKVCWAHSWEHPIGRVLHIEELMPGDDRLPTKTKDGKPWPREAGALVATMQFNLRASEGKDAFEAARFYSETGECEYSIGYNVPPGKSTRDNRGTRHIKALDLYELSVVLFGAHTMTGTISIKAALDAAIERKAHRGATGTLTTRQAHTAKSALAAVRAGFRAEVKEVTDPVKPADDTAPDFTDGVMIAVYPDPAAADAIANHVAGPDRTTDKADLHVTLAYLGKTTDLSMGSDEVYRRVSEALQGEDSLAGQVGGIGTFPDSGDGAPTWVPVDVPGLSLLRETVVQALGDVVSDEHGFAPHMTIGYGLGLIEPLPEVPVKFTEVHVVYGTQTRTVALGSLPDDSGMKALDLAGLSESEVGRLTAAFDTLDALVEGKAGGADRNQGGADKLRRYWTTGVGGAKIAWDTPGDFTRCSAMLSEHMTPENAKGYCANRHKEMTGMWPGDKDNKGLLDDGAPASGAMTPAVAAAMAAKSLTYDPAMDTKESPVLPAGKGYPRLPGSFEERNDAISAAVTEALRGVEVSDDKWEWDHVSIDATFADHLIASRRNFDGTDTTETFDMDYEYSPVRGVSLGEPDPVELQIVAVDADENEDDDTMIGDMLPFSDNVLELASLFKAAHVSALQTKAGRVLSGQNERKLRDAVENLVNVLAAAGLNLALVEAADDHQGGTPTIGTGKRQERTPIDPAVDMSTTSRSASTKSLPETEAKGDVVVLDADSHRRFLDSLAAATDEA